MLSLYKIMLFSLFLVGILFPSESNNLLERLC